MCKNALFGSKNLVRVIKKWNKTCIEVGLRPRKLKIPMRIR
jgi:hypothetical protein